MSESFHATIGYCTNIHAGESLDAVINNLRSISSGVRQVVTGVEPLPVGLWLSQLAAVEAERQVDRLRRVLDELQIIPFTFNAFPFGNFHNEFVKHDVYRPDWTTAERLEYTRRIARLGDQLAPVGQVLSISTLPLGWPSDDSESIISRSVNNLHALAKDLAQIEAKSGRRIILAIEPEPGCILQTSADIVELFQNRLPQGCSAAEREIISRHLGVCHDVCHAAVMFENQADVLHEYRKAGISIGKVQVSAAIEYDWTDDVQTREQLLIDLTQFAEQRYLHQTVYRGLQHPVTNIPCATEIDDLLFFEDLPQALAALPELGPGQLRSHFHVPIYVEKFGTIRSTQANIETCLTSLFGFSEDPIEANSLPRSASTHNRTLQTNQAIKFTGHLEVETYTWQVSPQSIRQRSLVDSIASELIWLQQCTARIR
ncbi:MAG TPA: metabolite traffic protein EboE [Pirellulaceae bacterium]|nr:metabolite traffic protein EboE [Pirellulaceae bacterium]HMO90581.1 metabolite traffic protein EboE [Pirellulaceae bacterium]HMP67840.1 metabolite traffic protein EboE [Pirellulaceae bacterium]